MSVKGADLVLKGSDQMQRTLKLENTLRKVPKALRKQMVQFARELRGSFGEPIVKDQELTLPQTELWLFFLNAIIKGKRIASATQLYEYVRTTNHYYTRKHVSTYNADFLKTFKALKEKELIVDSKVLWSARSAKKYRLTWNIPLDVLTSTGMLHTLGAIEENQRAATVRNSLAKVLYK